MEVLSGRIILRPVDLERSLRFYGETLGLKIYREYGTGADRGVVFFIGGGYLEITGRAPPVDVDKLSLWLQVPNLDEVHARLQGGGLLDLNQPGDQHADRLTVLPVVLQQGGEGSGGRDLIPRIQRLLEIIKRRANLSTPTP